MSDLISRQAAIDALSMMQGIVAENGVRKGISMAWQQIKDLPSAQPEIIRCKDCKYYEIAWLKKDFTDDKRYKPSICVNGRYGITRKPDWFCANAERRTDEIN